MLLLIVCSYKYMFKFFLVVPTIKVAPLYKLMKYPPR
uniref:Uncharacterized protein n=1 Tax=Arundo donax TaxID=35708 RepID=A0A0A8ZTA4_ARUDO